MCLITNISFFDFLSLHYCVSCSVEYHLVFGTLEPVREYGTAESVLCLCLPSPRCRALMGEFRVQCRRVERRFNDAVVVVLAGSVLLELPCSRCSARGTGISHEPNRTETVALPSGSSACFIGLCLVAYWRMGNCGRISTRGELSEEWTCCPRWVNRSGRMAFQLDLDSMCAVLHFHLRYTTNYL
jgi:hypothetical protein